MIARILAEGAQGAVSACLRLKRVKAKAVKLPAKKWIRPGDDRLFFSFDLGVMNACEEVSYSFHVQDAGASAQSKPYAFSVWRKQALGDCLSLCKTYHGCTAYFKHITLDFTSQADCVRVRWLAKTSANTAHSVPVLSYAIQACLDFTVQASPFVWKLNRFTNTMITVFGSQILLMLDAHDRVCALHVQSELAGEKLYGLGERYDSVEQQGKTTDCRVVEHFAHQGSNSYLPIPFLMSSSGACWLADTARRLRVDLRNGLHYQVEADIGAVLLTEYFLFGQPMALLSALHRITGQAVLPPKWAFGLWISSNGWNTQREVQQQLDALKRYALPATALVLEAWSDEKNLLYF